jgi:hypothetical protein
MDWKPRAHPISDIRDWSKANRLEIQPDFQRKAVWSKAAQIALIDTIFRNIPIPKIYIKSVIRDEQTYRVVIDGQQRLTAILAFLEGKLKLRAPHFTFDDYDGMKFLDLPKEAKDKVLSYNIDFNEIFSPTDEEVRDLYARVNKYTVQLNRQELRRADFPGEFLALAEDLSNLKFFEDCNFFSAGQKRRMLDVEYICELLCILLEGIQNKKDSLDDFCERYTEFSQGREVVESEFNRVISDIVVIFSTAKGLVGTRFRQKADFYTLFSCVARFQKENKVIQRNKLTEVKNALLQLDELIEPHAETKEHREYAMHCISDGNSLSSRRWREDFLRGYIAPLYLENCDCNAEG